MKPSDNSERWFDARVVRSFTGVPQLDPTEFAAMGNPPIFKLS